jgi:hypothetical protein
MTEISATAQIGASPQQVWNPLFREASGQLTVGSTVILKMARPASGRVMTVKVKILAVEPGVVLR